MADIELVIKIPEVQKKMVDAIMELPPQVENDLISAIRHGTPLPKGHGDLIDRGKLKTHFIGTEQGTDLEVYLETTIIGAPTIIKADKTDKADKAESEVKDD